MPNELPPFQTDNADFGEPEGIRALWRFKVTAVITDAPEAATLVKARTYNGTASGAKDYIIKVASAKAVDDIFYATKPEGGTGAKYGTPQKKVVWMEVTGGGDKNFWAQVLGSDAIMSGELIIGYRYSWQQSRRTANGFEIIAEGARSDDPGDDGRAVYYQEANGVMSSPIANGTYVLIRPDVGGDGTKRNTIISYHLPAKRSAYMVLNQMDANGGIDWDFLKGHP